MSSRTLDKFAKDNRLFEYVYNSAIPGAKELVMTCAVRVATLESTMAEISSITTRQGLGNQHSNTQVAKELARGLSALAQCIRACHPNVRCVSITDSQVHHTDLLAVAVVAPSVFRDVKQRQAIVKALDDQYMTESGWRYGCGAWTHTAMPPPPPRTTTSARSAACASSSSRNAAPSSENASNGQVGGQRAGGSTTTTTTTTTATTGNKVNPFATALAKAAAAESAAHAPGPSAAAAPAQHLHVVDIPSIGLTASDSSASSAPPVHAPAAAVDAPARAPANTVAVPLRTTLTRDVGRQDASPSTTAASAPVASQSATPVTSTSPPPVGPSTTSATTTSAQPFPSPQDGDAATAGDSSAMSMPTQLDTPPGAGGKAAARDSSSSGGSSSSANAYSSDGDGDGESDNGGGGSDSGRGAGGDGGDAYDDDDNGGAQPGPVEQDELAGPGAQDDPDAVGYQRLKAAVTDILQRAKTAETEGSGLTSRVAIVEVITELLHGVDDVEDRSRAIRSLVARLKKDLSDLWVREMDPFHGPLLGSMLGYRGLNAKVARNLIDDLTGTKVARDKDLTGFAISVESRTIDDEPFEQLFGNLLPLKAEVTTVVFLLRCFGDGDGAAAKERKNNLRRASIERLEGALYAACRKYADFDGEGKAARQKRKVVDDDNGGPANRRLHKAEGALNALSEEERQVVLAVFAGGGGEARGSDSPLNWGDGDDDEDADGQDTRNKASDASGIDVNLSNMSIESARPAKDEDDDSDDDNDDDSARRLRGLPATSSTETDTGIGASSAAGESREPTSALPRRRSLSVLPSWVPRDKHDEARAWFEQELITAIADELKRRGLTV